MPSYKQFSLPLPNSEYRWVGVVLCIFVMMLDRVTLAIDIVQFRIQVICYLGDKLAQFRIQVIRCYTIFVMMLDRVTLVIDIVQFRIQVIWYLGDKVAQFRIQVPWWQTIFLMVIYVLKVSGPIRSESIFYLKNSSRSLFLLLHMCSGMFHMFSHLQHPNNANSKVL